MADVRALRQRAARRTSASALDEYRQRSWASSGSGSPRSRPRTRRRGSRSSGRADGDHHADADEPDGRLRRTRSTWSRSWTSTWRPRCSSSAEEAADALGVPRDRRVYLRGWRYATDPVYVAEHPDLWRVAGDGARPPAPRSELAGVGIDDVAHLDLYSCFGSSVNFMRDALGIGGRRPAPADRHRRPAVPRRCGERLPHARDRDRWCGCCGTTRARSVWSPASGCT